MYELSDTKRARQTDRQTNSIWYNWWGCVLENLTSLLWGCVLESVNIDCFGCLGLRLSLPWEFLAHAPIYLVQNIATTPHHQKIKLYVPGYTGNPAHVPVTDTPVIPGKFGQVCIFRVGQDILPVFLGPLARFPSIIADASRCRNPSTRKCNTVFSFLDEISNSRSFVSNSIK